MSEDQQLGPIDYLVLEFKEPNFQGEGLPILLDLVDKGIIRILDAAFVRPNGDGGYVGMTIDELDNLGGQWEQFKGVSSGLLNQDDFDSVGSILQPGSMAGILIYENAWAGPFAAAMRKAGGAVVSNGRVAVADVVTALERLDADQPS